MKEKIMENEESNFLTLASLGAIFGFIIPLIMWILRKEEFSDYTKKMLVDLLNFELIIFIIFVVLTFIPILGWIAEFAVAIFNLIVALRCFSATRERKEFAFPFNVTIIK